MNPVTSIDTASLPVVGRHSLALHAPNDCEAIASLCSAAQACSSLVNGLHDLIALKAFLAAF
jgi:hypothetical protein